MPDFSAVRRHFPVVERLTYLNSAAIGPMPDFLLQSYEQAVLNRQLGLPDDGPARARAGLSAYLGVPEDAITFWANTTQAINMVAGSVDWRPGDEVVVNDIDFPANLAPWLRLRERGVVVKAAHAEGGRLAVDAILRQLTPATRLVAVSHVFYQTGFRVDIDTLGAELHRRGVWLAVDGIQALGLMAPPLRHVDFYMGASFKHLLGPRGLGIMYVRPEVAEHLTPVLFSDRSLVAEEVPWGDKPLNYKPGAGRFQLGHANTEALHALADLMTFFDAVGFDAIQARVTALAGQALSGLASIPGVAAVTPLDSAERLGLAVFRVDGVDAEAAVAGLRERDVVCAAREGGVRAAFHMYNDDADVERLLVTVRALAKRRSVQ